VDLKGFFSEPPLRNNLTNYLVDEKAVSISHFSCLFLFSLPISSSCRPGSSKLLMGCEVHEVTSFFVSPFLSLFPNIPTQERDGSVPFRLTSQATFAYLLFSTPFPLLIIKILLLSPPFKILFSSPPFVPFIVRQFIQWFLAIFRMATRLLPTDKSFGFEVSPATDFP